MLKMHFCRALVCLVLAAAITYANGESSVWDNVGQVGWDNAEQLGAAVKVWATLAAIVFE